MGILLFVLKNLYISLLLKMINGFSRPAKIMVSPFKTKRNIEYKIAVSKGKLRKHFKKRTLDLDASWKKSSFCIFLIYLC